MLLSFSMRLFLFLFLLALPATAAPRPELVLQIPHAGTISKAVFSPSGQTIAATSEESGAIKLWDARTGELRHTLEGASWNSDIAFSADGRAVLSSQYGKLRVWDALSGHLLRERELNWGDFSPDAKRLAALGNDGKTSWIEIWAVANGTQTRTLNFALGAEAATNYVTCAAWSPDGTLVAAARRSGSVTLWNADAGARLKTFEFSPRAVAPTPDAALWIDALAFSADGKSLAASSSDGVIRVAQTDSGRITRKLTASKKPDWTQTKALLFARDSRVLLQAMPGGAVRVWDVANGKLSGQLPNTRGAQSLAFSGDGATLLVGGLNPGLSLWDAQKLELRKSFAQTALWSDALFAVRASPDARFLSVAPYHGAGALWDWKTLTRFALPPVAGVWVPHAPLMVGARDDALEWRRVPTGELWKRQTVKSKRGIEAIAAAPDGQTLAVFSRETATLRAARTGEVVRQLPPREGAKTAVAFSPDGRWLAAGGDDEMGWGDERGTVTLWDLRAPHSAPRVLAAHNGVQALAWSRDSQTLAVGCGNAEGDDRWGEIQLWDAPSAKLQRYLLGHAGPVSALDWRGADLLAASRADVKSWRLPNDLKSAGQTRPLWSHNAGAKTLMPASSAANFALVREDGALEIRRRADNVLRATLTSLPARGEAFPAFLAHWILWTPDGYYTGSPDCEKWIRWREDGKLYPAAKYRARRRPDLVRAALL